MQFERRRWHHSRNCAGHSLLACRDRRRRQNDQKRRRCLRGPDRRQRGRYRSGIQRNASGGTKRQTVLSWSAGSVMIFNLAVRRRYRCPGWTGSTLKLDGPSGSRGDNSYGNVNSPLL